MTESETTNYILLLLRGPDRTDWEPRVKIIPFLLVSEVLASEHAYVYVTTQTNLRLFFIIKMRMLFLYIKWMAI